MFLVEKDQKNQLGKVKKNVSLEKSKKSSAWKKFSLDRGQKVHLGIIQKKFIKTEIKKFHFSYVKARTD